MSVKIYMSHETWRTGNDQHLTLEPVFQNWRNLPIYVDRPDRDAMMRETRRSGDNTIFVASLAVISDEESDLKFFLAACKAKKTDIESIEEKYRWHYGSPNKGLIEAWKIARSSGAAKIGASMSAATRKAKSALGIAKIKDKWPLPSSEHSTADLLAEAGVSLNTAKAYLGKRPIAQYNYQASRKRKERRNAKT